MASDSQPWSLINSSLEVLAHWHILRGRPEAEVVAAVGPEAPAHVRSAWKELVSLSASDVADRTGPASASERVHQALSRLDARAVDILRRRVFADNPATLEEIGQSFGVTRERVRQIESRAVKELRNSQALAEVRFLATSSLSDKDVVAPVDVLIGDNPALTENVVRVRQPLWRVLDRLDDSFEIADGWWCRSSARHAAHLTRSAMKAAAEDARAIRIDDVPMLKGRGWAADWAKYCGVPVHEGYALLESSGIPDRAAVTLEVEGAPLSGDEIALRIGSDRAVRSVKNALGADERFVRVDRNSWALTSWGLETYQSIRQLIADEVSAHGGTIRLSRLVTSITERFSVSATSVMGYASALPFSTVDGLVGMASINTEVARKSPFDTRRLFRIPTGWMMRFVVTSEHARGSGSALPSALIPVLGLSYGEAKYRPGRLGDQRLGWSGAQATLGSVKRFVDSDGLQIGAICFAVFEDDGSFDIRQASITEAAGQDRAFDLSGLRLAGYSPTFHDLVHAIGLPPTSTRHQVAEKLRLRGDYDIADCMLVDVWGERGESDAS